MKLGAMLSFVLIASSMQASAANVYLNDHGWYVKEFYVKKPGDQAFVSVPSDAWPEPQDKTVKTVNTDLPEGSTVCIAVNMAQIDAERRTKHQIHTFKVRKDGTSSITCSNYLWDPVCEVDQNHDLADLEKVGVEYKYGSPTDGCNGVSVN